MDEMHKVAVKWFRATHKHQYAPICLDYAYLLMNLNPALLQLFQSIGRALGPVMMGTISHGTKQTKS